ncbi:MAG: hypothetical protein HQL01_15475 [Nitrospirae bacterium]|nr:hypothetical protein [Nitrospirota bacterium]
MKTPQKGVPVAGLAQAELINKLEEDVVKRGITAVHDKAAKELIKSIDKGMWYEPVRGCGFEIAEAVHCMNKTEKSGDQERAA